MKTLIAIFLPHISGMLFLLMTVNPKAVWVALLFGAVVGFGVRLLFERAKKPQISKVVFESLGMICLIAGCGMLALEAIFYYFELQQKIDAGKVSPEIPLYIASTLSCLVTFTGKDGVMFARSIIRTMIERKLNAPQKSDDILDDK